MKDLSGAIGGVGSDLRSYGVTSPDAPMAILATVLLAAVLPITVLVAPLLVGQLIGQLHFTASDSGYLLSMELAAICTATAIALALMDRVSWRMLVALCLVVTISGNICSAFATSFELLAFLRVCVGLGSGTIIALGLAAIGKTRNKDRNFGLWLICQLLSAVIALLILSWIFKIWGIAGFYFGIAAIEAALFPLVYFFHEGGGFRKTKSVAPPSDMSPIAVAGLISILFICVAIGGVWAYVERIGHASALDSIQIGMILAGATSLGIVGAGTASFLGGRVLRTRLLIVGFMIVLSAIALFIGRPPEMRFALAAGLFKFAWTFIVPFMLASISSRDPSGKLIVTANFVLGGGQAIGPAVGAFILRLGGSYDRVLAVMLVFAVVSALILLIPELRSERQGRALMA